MSRTPARFAAIAVLVLAAAPLSAAPEPTVEELVAQARTKLQAGRVPEALETINKAIARRVNNADAHAVRGLAYRAMGKDDDALADFDKAIDLGLKSESIHYHRARIHTSAGRFDKSVADLAKVLELKPDFSGLRRDLGRDLFKLGKFDESIAEFDKLAAAVPGTGPGLWERGLAYYYAGRFKDAVKQFTGYDTVDKLDIENGLWHYLSSAKIDGLEAAKKSMLGYQQKKRPPFPALLELYAGNGSEDVVLKQAEEGMPDGVELKMNRFFAHLYLGKHHQANGRLREALAHFEKAVKQEITIREFASGNFMWHCARIELALTQEALKAGK